MGALRKLITGHRSLMVAMKYYRGADDPDEKAVGNMIDEHLPIIRSVIERQFPVAISAPRLAGSGMASSLGFRPPCS
jgi:hypothetical protein